MLGSQDRQGFYKNLIENAHLSPEAISRMGIPQIMAIWSERANPQKQRVPGLTIKGKRRPDRSAR